MMIQGLLPFGRTLYPLICHNCFYGWVSQKLSINLGTRMQQNCFLSDCDLMFSRMKRGASIVEQWLLKRNSVLLSIFFHVFYYLICEKFFEHLCQWWCYKYRPEIYVRVVGSNTTPTITGHLTALPMFTRE